VRYSCHDIEKPCHMLQGSHMVTPHALCGFCRYEWRLLLCYKGGIVDNRVEPDQQLAMGRAASFTLC
jgi:hypothetical protein